MELLPEPKHLEKLMRPCKEVFQNNMFTYYTGGIVVTWLNVKEKKERERNKEIRVHDRKGKQNNLINYFKFIPTPSAVAILL